MTAESLRGGEGRGRGRSSHAGRGIVRTIADPYQQVRALTLMAEVVGLPRAAHLLGEAFVRGRG
jgi:hypothetical protein